MCGIWGYIGRPKKKKRPALFRLMSSIAVASEIRGTHSTGFYAINDDDFFFQKSTMRPKNFIKRSKLMKKAIKSGSYVFLGHNRLASVGSINVKNAHPFEGNRFVQVHNGTCPETLKFLKRNELKENMEGTTDSEAMMHVLDAFGIKGAIDMLNSITSYSVAILDKETEKVFFFRDVQRPMFVADMRKDYGVRIFASTPEIIEEALLNININPESYSGFATKPFYLYEANWETAEFTRKAKYASDKAEKRSRREKARKDIIRRVRSGKYGYRYPTYTPPKSRTEEEKDWEAWVAQADAAIDAYNELKMDHEPSNLKPSDFMKKTNFVKPKVVMPAPKKEPIAKRPEDVPGTDAWNRKVGR